MLGRYPGDCLVRNRSYQGVVMKPIDRATVRQYWWDIHGISRMACLGVLLIVGGIFGLVFIDYINHLLWDSCFVAGLMGLAIFANALMSAHKRNEKPLPPEYQLLGKWERYSGEPLSLFPTTSSINPILLKILTVRELVLRAEALNRRYWEEESFRYAWRNVNWKNLSYRKYVKLYKKRTRQEKPIKARVKREKDWFLNYWDLVTENEGIGILTGPQWQDPESFRQNVLSAKDTASLIEILVGE